jgi:threonylcarbamoyladenosine tRNA methylthiotransferase MtaB
MKRPYTTDQYRRLTEQLRARIPGLAITTDIIVGFPGESDEDFAASLEFVRQTHFARVHAFPYSRRPGTTAADLPEHIDPQTIRQRMQRMLRVAEAGRRTFEASQIGQTVPVLWESLSEQGRVGTSDNYLRVEIDGEAEDIGEITDVTVESLNETGVGASRPVPAGATVPQPRPDARPTAF